MSLAGIITQQNNTTNERIGDVHRRIDDVQVNVLALRREMHGLRTEVRSEMNSLRTEMNLLRAELRAEMNTLRTEIQTDIRELRTLIVETLRERDAAG